MRQLLLNNGLLEGGRWGRKAGLAAAGPGLGLDPHTVAFVAKSLLRQGQSASYDTIMEMSAAAQAIMHLSEDHAEGVAALIEKRTPTFTGR